jgi:thiamine biosynthesis protein ThiI
MQAQLPTGDRESGATPRAEAQHRVLVRLSGDLATKARETRRRFATRLGRNLRSALRSAGIEAEVIRTHDRFWVKSESEIPLDVVTRVFGVQSASPAIGFAWSSLEDLVERGTALFSEAVRDKSFAVRARRVGSREQIPLRSADLQRDLGTALLKTARRVDLGNPEVEAQIEVMPEAAWFFTESLRGPGGLPLGVEGRALALVSGGFDSAVAAWQMMKRGVALDFVFCNLGGRIHQLGTLRVMQHLAENWCSGTKPRFHSLDFSAVVQDLERNVTPRYRQVVLKRLMLRAAAAIAPLARAEAIITGDAVGQVSSQTLTNLATISRATELPILRPLVGLNKDEILAIARQIGTFDLSKVVGEYCALVPKKPATAASLAAILAEEERLDPGLIERIVEQREILFLHDLDGGILRVPELEAEAIHPNDTVIDLRSRQAYDAWHYPGALFLDFAHAERAWPTFSKDERYVLYCEFGLVSAHLVELMRGQGFDASHFRGGAPALRRQADPEA